MGIRVTTVNALPELIAVQDKWQALADRSLEINLFYHPMLFLPAFRQLSTDLNLVVVLIENEETDELLGFFPLRIETKYRGLPLPHCSLWIHKHSVSAVPLIAMGFEALVFQSFLGWMSTSAYGLRCVRFHFFTENTNLKQLATSQALSMKCQVDHIDKWQRSLLRTNLNSEEYFARFHVPKKRLDHGRLWRRLNEKGELTFYSGKLATDQAGSWLSEFLALEHSGWKGAAGSSIASNEAEKLFFSEALIAAAERQSLSISRLTLDGNLIAAECSFLDPSGSIILKMAYDENYSKYSPGVLLILKKTEALLQAGDNTWVDSCATQGHKMMNSLWKQRLPVSDFAISDGRFSSNLLFFLIKYLVVFKRRIGRGGL